MTLIALGWTGRRLDAEDRAYIAAIRREGRLPGAGCDALWADGPLGWDELERGLCRVSPLPAKGTARRILKHLTVGRLDQLARTEARASKERDLLLRARIARSIKRYQDEQAAQDVLREERRRWLAEDHRRAAFAESRRERWDRESAEWERWEQSHGNPSKARSFEVKHLKKNPSGTVLAQRKRSAEQKKLREEHEAREHIAALERAEAERRRERRRQADLEREHYAKPSLRAAAASQSVADTQARLQFEAENTRKIQQRARWLKLFMDEPESIRPPIWRGDRPEWTFARLKARIAHMVDGDTLFTFNDTVDALGCEPIMLGEVVRQLAREGVLKIVTRGPELDQAG